MTASMPEVAFRRYHSISPNAHVEDAKHEGTSGPGSNLIRIHAILVEAQQGIWFCPKLIFEPSPLIYSSARILGRFKKRVNKRVVLSRMDLHMYYMPWGDRSYKKGEGPVDPMERAWSLQYFHQSGLVH